MRVFDLENAAGAPIYVHAKVCVVDDVWFTCGSDNVNRARGRPTARSPAPSSTPSATRASPADLAGAGDGARRLPRDLRLQLWAEHLGLAPDDPRLLDPVTAFDLWRRPGRRARRLAPAVAAGRGRPAGPGVHRPEPVPGGPGRGRSRSTVWSATRTAGRVRCDGPAGSRLVAGPDGPPPSTGRDVVAGRRSAGILLWRKGSEGIEVLVAHMGGPVWARRTVGSWSVPKGEYLDDEDPFEAALREFAEELGQPVPATEFLDLGSVRQKSGKVVTVWAAEGDLDPGTCVSNTYEVEWPPRSGRVQTFPEIDRVAWMTPEDARAVVVPAQAELFDRLVAALDPPAERSRSAAGRTLLWFVKPVMVLRVGGRAVGRCTA